jgi:ribosomal protein S18 acetylase RimI-like enzyme
MLSRCYKAFFVVTMPNPAKASPMDPKKLARDHGYNLIFLPATEDQSQSDCDFEAEFLKRSDIATLKSEDNYHMLDLAMMTGTRFVLEKLDTKELVACLELGLNEDEGMVYIDALITAPKFRRQGAAKLLLAIAEDYAWSNECLKVKLHVYGGDDNKPAINLYKSFGFVRGEYGQFVLSYWDRNKERF